MLRCSLLHVASNLALLVTRHVSGVARACLTEPRKVQPCCRAKTVGVSVFVLFDTELGFYHLFLGFVVLFVMARASLPTSLNVLQLVKLGRGAGAGAAVGYGEGILPRRRVCKAADLSNFELNESCPFYHSHRRPSDR